MHERGSPVKAIYEDDVFVNEGEGLPKDYADRKPRKDSKNRAWKSLRLFETFNSFNALGRVEDKGGFQENKRWRNCW